MQAIFLLVQDPTFLSAPLTKEKPPRIRSGLELKLIQYQLEYIM